MSDEKETHSHVNKAGSSGLSDTEAGIDLAYEKKLM